MGRSKLNPGFIAKPGQTTNGVATAYKETGIYTAGEAIPVGSWVMISVADTTGTAVLKGTSAAGPRFVGIYEGVGGTGADAASPFTGKAALTGDRITVTKRGRAIALVLGAAGLAAGDPLGPESTAGVLEEDAPATGDLFGSRIVVLEAYTTTSAAGKAVYIGA